MTISAHRLVADIFLPNFWEYKRRNQLHAHHMDHNKKNNFYRNILFVPIGLHYIMNLVDTMCVVVDGKAVPIVTPYDLISDDLTLDEIIMAGAAREKKSKVIDGYEIHEIKGLQIGFKYIEKPNK